MAADHDDFVRVEELPELLRSYGVLPAETRGHEFPHQRMVPASAARSVLGAFERHLKGLHDQKDHGRKKLGSLLDVLRNAKSGDRKKVTDRLNAATREELADVASKLDTVKKPGKNISRNQLIDNILEGTVGFRERAEAIGGFGNKGKPIGLRDMAKPSARTVETDAAQILSRLHDGRKVRADPSTIDDLMKRIAADGTVFNFANLNVAGRGNGNLFQKHLRDRPRETMPQLPTETGADMDRFMDYLTGKGVGFEYGTIDPRKLVASQSELNGPKVAKLYGFMRDDGWKPGGTMIISRDGAVIDGHHRWAGAAAASIARGGTMDVTVMKIDADLDDILGTDENPDGIVMGFAKFESLADDREG